MMPKNTNEAAAEMENPDQAWKSLYHNELAEVEEARLDQEFPCEKMIRRLPRFSLKESLIVLLIGIGVSIGLSWHFRGSDNDSGWWSGLFQNLAMGMVSGWILLWFSNRQQCVVTGYTSLIDLMKKRLQTFRDVLSELRDPNVMFFNIGDYEAGIGWLLVHVNFIHTMESHFRYFNKYMKEDVGLGHYADCIANQLKKLGSVDQLISKDYSPDSIRKVCGDVWELESSILAVYGKVINQIEERVFDVRLGKKALYRWEEMQNAKGTNGSITKEVLSDFMREKSK